MYWVSWKREPMNHQVTWADVDIPTTDGNMHMNPDQAENK